MMDELRTMARNPQHYSNCTMAIALHQVLDRLEAAERERNAIERNRDGWRMAAKDAHGHTLAAEHERDELRDQLTASQAREAGLRQRIGAAVYVASLYEEADDPVVRDLAQKIGGVLEDGPALSQQEEDRLVAIGMDVVEDVINDLSERDELRTKIAASQAREAGLRDALERFVDDEPCRYDHHGYCQAHSCFNIPCHMAEARAILSAAPPREGE